MEQIIETITSLLSEISAFVSEFLLLSDNLLLIAGLGGVLLLLLLILVILRRRRNRYSSEDGDIEFLEVGPEPVIVYRRGTEQAEPKEQPIPEQSAPEPQPIVQAEPEPVPEVETELEPEPEPKPVLTGAFLDEDPLPEPIMDPEPQPDSEPEDTDEGNPEPNQGNPPNLEPLPYLESDLANDTLNLFNQQGFHIEKIVYQGIYGGDFIAVRPGVRAYVQVKDWKKKLTANTIAEVNSYANTNDCNQAIIVTSASIHRAAVKSAARMNVSLWNQKSLKRFKKKPFFPELDQAAATRE